MSIKKRGGFFVFEGCDRSGKTTQSRLLMEFLKKNRIAAKHINFPDRSTVTGQVINSYLTNSLELPDEAIHLMFSVNRWERINNIKKELLEGTTIVCDRYAYSGAAYTAAKGLDFEWCYAPDRGLIKPDAVFYLKTNADKLTSRGSYGEERYEKLEFQRKVGEVFDRFCAQESSYWHQFDASQSEQELQAQIANIAQNVLNQSGDQPLDKLK